MKKIILTAIIALGIPSFLSAQKKGDFELGFNAGYNISSATSYYVSTERGKGFNIGGSLNYYFTRSWSIEGKLIYDQKGWDNDRIEDDQGTSYNSDYNLNYLTVPIMANYYFGDDEKDKKNWFIEFGPYAGFLLSAKENRFGTDIKESFYKNDFGLTLGAGVKIPVMDKFNMFFELEWQRGFTNIFNHASTAIRNQRTSFNVGVNYLLQ
ncbi:porin family protein [Flavobacterium terrisoli]|uniref:porin family protein n=1 Tax=Flavobacterium terrisoli TaxID=3242195 RepID=UPI002542910D|nr:porin family protein [Flavobacterium buctense]